MGPRLGDGHILRLIAERARRQGDGAALNFVVDSAGTRQTLTWAEVQRLAWRARLAFKARGLAPGDRILLMLPTGADYLAAVLGAFWAGLAPATLAPLSAPRRRATVAKFGPLASSTIRASLEV